MTSDERMTTAPVPDSPGPRPDHRPARPPVRLDYRREPPTLDPPPLGWRDVLTVLFVLSGLAILAAMAALSMGLGR